jgi:hypothetical protein
MSTELHNLTAWTDEERQQILIAVKKQPLLCGRCNCAMNYVSGTTQQWLTITDHDPIAKLAVFTDWECPKCHRRAGLIEQSMERPYDLEKRRARTHRISESAAQLELPIDSW